MIRRYIFSILFTATCSGSVFSQVPRQEKYSYKDRMSQFKEAIDRNFFESQVLSPDKAINLKFLIINSRLCYQVTYKGAPVINISALSLVADGREIGKSQSFGNIKRSVINESYTWRGVHSKARNHCREIALYVNGENKESSFIINARVFNDGVAFRYIIERRGESTVSADNTEFKIPEGSLIWSQPDKGNYEGKYQKQRIEDVKAGQKAGPPLTIELAGNKGYAAITEGGLTDFAGMSLIAAGNRKFNASLTGNVIKKGIIETPWRIIEIGSDLNTLVNCDIIANVSPEMDPVLFPKGFDTEWIKPGKSVWSWLAGNGGVTFDNMKRYSKWAGQLGIEYNLVDEGWSRWGEGGKDKWTLLKELVEYSDTQHVKIWVWKAYPNRGGVPGLKDPEERWDFFKKCKDLGVAGLKIDFFDTESQEVINFYQAALRDAAKLHLMLDFHGANKPTGESRTWPNEMTREGIRGLENGTSWPKHNTTLPFTRYLAGHGDYTPLTFRDIAKGTTLAHQVASAAAFTSPFLCLAVNPEELLSSPVKNMVTGLPAFWDETIVLPQSDIGELAVMARRYGSIWYLIALNGESSRNFNVDLSFLGRKKYRSYSIQDDEKSPENVIIREDITSRKSSMAIEMVSGGGFIARFSEY